MSQDPLEAEGKDTLENGSAVQQHTGLEEFRLTLPSPQTFREHGPGPR